MGEKKYDYGHETRLHGRVGTYSRVILCHCGRETNFVFRRVSDHTDVVACSQKCAEEVERKSLDIQKTKHGTRAKFKVN